MWFIFILYIIGYYISWTEHSVAKKIAKVKHRWVFLSFRRARQSWQAPGYHQKLIYPKSDSFIVYSMIYLSSWPLDLVLHPLYEYNWKDGLNVPIQQAVEHLEFILIEETQNFSQRHLDLERDWWPGLVFCFPNRKDPNNGKADTARTLLAGITSSEMNKPLAEITGYVTLLRSQKNKVANWDGTKTDWKMTTLLCFVLAAETESTDSPSLSLWPLSQTRP